ncbi:helix-turn-helix domain-containing protein [Nocardia takedensis]|uniref:helix-turn-helix domain-containing protein n=1 Tax=Nocardia takedensis TaxID=259390 RepID=UPI0002DCE388|nr:helix-turn-helix transcriptional regulator [Nocardia takedensis]
MTDVDQARQALGARLRELRTAAGLSGARLADFAGWPASKVSKLEHGRQLPTEQDLVDWCQLTDADLALPDLIATVRNVNAAYLEWRRVIADGHARRQRQSIELESVTRLIRGYDPLISTGLLQTRAYAEAILSRCIEFAGGANDLAEALDARMARQAVLRDGVHRFHFLIGEPALHTGVGDETVRRGQLTHLLDLMSLTRVVIGVVPMSAEFLYTTTNFVIYDRRRVHVETVTAQLTITQPRELVQYERTFTALTERALYGEAARTMITNAL